MKSTKFNADQLLQGLDSFVSMVSLPHYNADGWSMDFKERVETHPFANSLAEAIGESSVCWITDGMGLSHRAHFAAEWSKVRPQVFQAIKKFAETGKKQDISFS